MYLCEKVSSNNEWCSNKQNRLKSIKMYYFTRTASRNPSWPLSTMVGIVTPSAMITLGNSFIYELGAVSYHFSAPMM